MTPKTQKPEEYARVIDTLRGPWTSEVDALVPDKILVRDDGSATACHSSIETEVVNESGVRTREAHSASIHFASLDHAIERYGLIDKLIPLDRHAAAHDRRIVWGLAAAAGLLVFALGLLATFGHSTLETVAHPAAPNPDGQRRLCDTLGGTWRELPGLVHMGSCMTHEGARLPEPPSP